MRRFLPLLLVLLLGLVLALHVDVQIAVTVDQQVRDARAVLTLLAALGQLFYSMSLAMGIMISTAAAMVKDCVAALSR